LSGSVGRAVRGVVQEEGGVRALIEVVGDAARRGLWEGAVVGAKALGNMISGTVEYNGSPPDDSALSDWIPETFPLTTVEIDELEDALLELTEYGSADAAFSESPDFRQFEEVAVAVLSGIDRV
ncbi:hypothetical protein HDU93_006056, partial [Gonapodya sp. JEL0774]